MEYLKKVVDWKLNCPDHVPRKSSGYEFLTIHYERAAFIELAWLYYDQWFCKYNYRDKNALYQNIVDEVLAREGRHKAKIYKWASISMYGKAERLWRLTHQK